ncbi:MAG: P-loop NTPase [Pseudonocardiaceae bacterium]
MRTTEVPVIAVASGKGGVGKTSVSVGLARSLTGAGLTVGLVDADLYGPDVPRMLGLRRDTPARWVPVTGSGGTDAVAVDGIQVASAGFLLGGTQGLAVGAGIAELLLRRLLTETRWRNPDLLVVDLPPGTADILQAVLKSAARLTVVVVVTPAEVSHLDSGRLITVLRQLTVPILGGVENMAHLACPCCGHPIELYPPAPAERTIWSLGVTKLATVPYRPSSQPTTDDLAGLAVAVRAQLSNGD